MRELPATFGLNRRSMLKIMAGSSVAVMAGCSSDSGSNAKRTVVFESIWSEGDPRFEAEKQTNTAFTEATGIAVEVRFIPYVTAKTDILRKVAARKVPDVTFMLDTWLLDLVDQGALQSLSEYTADWSEERRSDYVFPFEDMVFNEELYGMRFTPRPGNALFYNGDLYNRAGIDSAPKTFSELNSALTATSQGNTVGMSLPLITTGTLLRLLAYWRSMMWDLGGELVDENSAPTFHEEPGIRAAQWFQDQVYQANTMPKSSATASDEDIDKAFVAGRMSSTFANTDNLGDYRSRGLDSVTLAPMPNFVDDTSKPGSAFLAGGWAYVAPTGGNKDLAWEYIKFTQEKEAELIKARVGGGLPTRASVLNEPYFETPEAAPTMEILNWMKASPHPAPLKIARADSLIQSVGGAFQEIIANQADVAASLSTAAERYAAG